MKPDTYAEAVEPFLRLAREVINPVNGERPWHADSKDWMVVFSFGGHSITLGDLRRAAAVQASGDREGHGTDRPVIDGESSRDEPSPLPIPQGES